MTVLLLVLFVLAITAVYIGTIQAAFSALMRLSLRLTAERGRENGLGPYLDDPVQLFVPVRILMGLLVTLGTVLVASLLGVDRLHGLGTIVLAMVVFVAIFEHLLPLLIVRRNPEAVLHYLLPSFDPIVQLLKPITRSLVGITATLRRDRLASPSAEDDGDSHEEPDEVAHTFLEAGEHEGLIEREDRALLQSIVDFGDTLAREVMTPRPDIVAIRADATVAELRALLAEQEYSRVPAYDTTLDHIAGFIYIKDLVHQNPPGDRPIRGLLRPAFFIPETKRVAELLKDFQRQQVQAAIVVDEYGGTAGLVTLEDLLEEIVGEIRDEYDVELESVIDEGDGSFIFSGQAAIDDLMERLGVDIEREGFETVGGFLLSHAGRVPNTGETFDVAGLHVEVLEAQRRRVTRVRIRKQEQPAEQSTS